MKKIIIGALIVLGVLIYFDDEMFNLADVGCITHSKAIICNVKTASYAAEFQVWALRPSIL
mgnify:CR=1 FL=1